MYVTRVTTTALVLVLVLVVGVVVQRLCLGMRIERFGEAIDQALASASRLHTTETTPPVHIHAPVCLEHTNLNDTPPGANFVYLDALHSVMHADALRAHGWGLLVAAPTWRRAIFVDDDGVQRREIHGCRAWAALKSRMGARCPPGLRLEWLPPEPWKGVIGASAQAPTGRKVRAVGCPVDYHELRVWFPFLRRSHVDVRSLFPDATNPPLERVQTTMDVQMLLWARVSWHDAAHFRRLAQGTDIYALNVYATKLPLHPLAAKVLERLVVPVPSGAATPPRSTLHAADTRLLPLASIHVTPQHHFIRPEDPSLRPPYGRRVMMAQASIPYEHPGLRVEFEESPRAAGTVWYLSHKTEDNPQAPVYVLFDALAGAQWLGDGGRVSVKDLRPPPLGGVQEGDRLLVPGHGIVEVAQSGGDPEDHTVSVRRVSTGLAQSAEALEDKELDFGYSCFGPDGVEGVRFRGECLWKGGTWDARCRRDEECPFFQANLRYPNYHGGCHNGYCEMPLGVTRVGYTRYTGTPVCYDDDCTQGGVAFSGVPSLESSP